MVLQKYTGPEFFRHRIVCSALSGNPVRISEIRANEEEPGLKDYEASLLRLLTKITSGTVVEIDPTGTTMLYKPGTLIGGSRITHECPKSRAVGYFLEVILCLGPFCKKPLNITMKGITNDNIDPTADSIRTVFLPMLKFFGLDEDLLELKILKRGAPPLGGGEVLLKCPIATKLVPTQFTRQGRVKRIRGIAYGTRIAPEMVNRVVDTARTKLTPWVKDVYFHTDHYRGESAGLSPGLGITLVAESNSGVLYCGEWMAASSTDVTSGEDTAAEARDSKQPAIQWVPEDVGSKSASLLLEEIYWGGCVDSVTQYLLLLYMALSGDVSRIRLGRLSKYSEGLLSCLKDFFGVTFEIRKARASDERVYASQKRVLEEAEKKEKKRRKKDEEEEEEEKELVNDGPEDEEGETLIVTCVGVGYLNLARRVQ